MLNFCFCYYLQSLNIFIQLILISFYYQMISYFLAIILIFCYNETFDLVNCPMELTSLDRFTDKKSNGTLTLIQKFIKNRTQGRQQKIPYFIFQTNQYDMIPFKMKYAVSSIIQKNPQYTYRYFNGTQRSQFIQKYMGSVILKAYKKLIPNAFKADLFRYCVMYLYGGCYVDIAEVMLDGFNSVLDSETTFLSTVDGVKGSRSIYLNVGFFCSVPGHQIIRRNINNILQAVANQRYGVSALDVTGPNKLGDTFKQYTNNYSSLLPRDYDGGIRILDQDMTPWCVSFVVPKPNGDIIVSSRYPDYYQNMQYYVKNTGHYSQMYNSRSIYDRNINISIPENYSINFIHEMNTSYQDFKIPPQFRINY